MQIFKVRAVLLSRRLSQVANSRLYDSDLFYASLGRSETIIAEGGIEKKGQTERESRRIRARGQPELGRGTGGLRDPVAFFMIVRRSSRHWSLVGAGPQGSFFLRENLIRPAVGSARTRFEITFTRLPFFPPRAVQRRRN